MIYWRIRTYISWDDLVTFHCSGKQQSDRNFVLLLHTSFSTNHNRCSQTVNILELHCNWLQFIVVYITFIRFFSRYNDQDICLCLLRGSVHSNMDSNSVVLAALQSRTGPVQGQNRVFPVYFSHTGKNLFSLQGSQVIKTGFSLWEKLHREIPVIITRMGLQCSNVAGITWQSRRRTCIVFETNISSWKLHCSDLYFMLCTY